jgi:hypothetical protein
MKTQVSDVDLDSLKSLKIPLRLLSTCGLSSPFGILVPWSLSHYPSFSTAVSANERRENEKMRN